MIDHITRTLPLSYASHTRIDGFSNYVHFLLYTSLMDHKACKVLEDGAPFIK